MGLLVAKALPPRMRFNASCTFGQASCDWYWLALALCRFFDTTPSELISSGLYNQIAVAFHEHPFREVSLALAGQKLGAHVSSRAESARSVVRKASQRLNVASARASSRNSTRARDRVFPENVSSSSPA